jgi:hypothetical protein
VLQYPDYIAITPKTGNNGSAYNFALLNGLSLYGPGFCPNVVPPAASKPTSCGTLYQDTNTVTTPVKEFELTLIDPSLYGGTYFVAIDVLAYSAVNKFEIVHNGVKKATSGMSAGGNYTPFDNTDVTPAYPYTLGAIQYIGDAIPISATPPYVYTPIPARVAQFTTDTGKSIPLNAGFSQRVWWKYTSADYAVSKKVNIRVCGESDYRFYRICE